MAKHDNKKYIIVHMIYRKQNTISCVQKPKRQNWQAFQGLTGLIYHRPSDENFSFRFVRSGQSVEDVASAGITNMEESQTLDVGISSRTFAETVVTLNRLLKYLVSFNTSMSQFLKLEVT